MVSNILRSTFWALKMIIYNWYKGFFSIHTVSIFYNFFNLIEFVLWEYETETVALGLLTTSFKIKKSEFGVTMHIDV